ncbi:MAG: hypothetical protein ACO3TG_03780, partial [Minisyncoccia bacterium]
DRKYISSVHPRRLRRHPCQRGTENNPPPSSISATPPPAGVDCQTWGFGVKRKKPPATQGAWGMGRLVKSD